MQVLLRVNTAGKPEKKIKVSRDVLIGRERGRCDLRVASSEVSRRHCQILVGEKTVDVRDLGSANGTRVNGEPIPAKTNFPVNPGDLVEIGPLEIRVEFRGAKARSRPVVENDDDFLSQDNALAALDEPGVDMEHSAAEILIENRLIDSGDDYGSSLETVDAAEFGEGELKSESESFDEDSSGNLPPQQLSPLDAEDVVDLEPLEPLEPDEEAGHPLRDLNAPVLEPAAAVSIPPESPETPLAETETESEDSAFDAGDGTSTDATKKGRLKSLFGRFGRKKEAGDSPPETAAADESTVAPPAPAEESRPNVEALPTAEFPLASSEPEAPSVDLAVPEGGEVWEPPEGEWKEDEEDLVSVEDLGAEYEDFDEVVDEDEDSQPADEGFADFLNQLDEPQ